MNDGIIKINISGKRGILREFSLIFIGAIFLFGSAGTINWVRGWVYIIIAILYQAIYIITLIIANPQLLNERGSFNWKETKIHDKYFTIFYLISGILALIVAGFDVVRFKWSYFPFTTTYPGTIIFILASLLALWAYVNNSNFILTHRNDKIANQPVCSSGPYRYIRHPAYLAAIIASFCFPFIIGSLFSLIPVIINVILLIIRTYFEDKTLKIEVKRYDEYSRKTKYKLFPYLW